MTVIVSDPVLQGSNNNGQSVESYVEEQQNDGDLTLDGGFVVPDSNAFGRSFRDYEKGSERKAIVEEFYRTNHINQTYEFVSLFPSKYYCALSVIPSGPFGGNAFTHLDLLNGPDYSTEMSDGQHSQCRNDEDQ